MSLERVRLAVGIETDGDVFAGRTDLSGVEGGLLYGGQVVAQALSAAGSTAPAGSTPESIQAHLLSASHIGAPVIYEVERVRDGRALQHRLVRGLQDGKLVILATVVSAMPADGVDWQQPTMPAMQPPDPDDEGPPMVAYLGQGAFELARPRVDESAERPSHPFWIRTFDEVPDDPWLSAAVHAYWSDLGLNGDARARHEQLAGPTSSSSTMHAVWFHRRHPVREWHVLAVASQSLAGNQGQVLGWIFHGSSGALVASVAQSVFIRRPV